MSPAQAQASLIHPCCSTCLTSCLGRYSGRSYSLIRLAPCLLLSHYLCINITGSLDSALRSLKLGLWVSVIWWVYQLLTEYRISVIKVRIVMVVSVHYICSQLPQCLPIDRENRLCILIISWTFDGNISSWIIGKNTLKNVILMWYSRQLTWMYLVCI